MTVDYAAALLERLTLEEKAYLLDGLDFWHTQPLERVVIGRDAHRAGRRPQHRHLRQRPLPRHRPTRVRTKHGGREAPGEDVMTLTADVARLRDRAQREVDDRLIRPFRRRLELNQLAAACAP